MTDLLGLPLDTALKILSAKGVQARTVETAAPARSGEAPRTRGECRVVCQRGDTLVFARFLTDAPKEDML